MAVAPPGAPTDPSPSGVALTYSHKRAGAEDAAKPEATSFAAAAFSSTQASPRLSTPLKAGTSPVIGQFRIQLIFSSSTSRADAPTPSAHGFARSPRRKRAGTGAAGADTFASKPVSNGQGAHSDGKEGCRQCHRNSPQAVDAPRILSPGDKQRSDTAAPKKRITSRSRGESMVAATN